MKIKTVQILWHNKEAIFSADFEPSGNRLATGGADQTVRIWRIVKAEDQTASLEFLSTLKRHSAPVNCVRWSPKEGVLATAGDDGTILLWQKAELVESDEDLSVESWKVISSLRGSTSDIYDLAWSPDVQFIISACLDNTARVFSIAEQRCVQVLTNHCHFVQGVAWDPLNKYVATQSSDRSVSIYTLTASKTSLLDVKHKMKHSKLPVSLVQDAFGNAKNNEQESSDDTLAVSSTDESKQSSVPVTPAARPKTIKMYTDESLLSFFRRPGFSPDGSLFLTPAACLGVSSIEEGADNKDDNNFGAIMYTRGSLLKQPIAIMSNHKKASIAVRWNPMPYQLNTGEPYIQLAYRYVYAVATQDSVYVYDTEQKEPLAYFSNLHYSPFTDLAWSHDGMTLVMTSTDGFASMVVFEDGEIGQVYDGPLFSISGTAVEEENKENVTILFSKDEDTPMVESVVKPIAESTLEDKPCGVPNSPCPTPVTSGENPQKKRRIAPIFVSGLGQ